MRKNFTEERTVRKILQHSDTRHDRALQEAFRLLLSHDNSAWGSGYITAVTDIFDALLSTVDGETAAQVIASFEAIAQERRIHHAR